MAISRSRWAWRYSDEPASNDYSELDAGRKLIADRIAGVGEASFQEAHRIERGWRLRNQGAQPSADRKLIPRNGISAVVRTIVRCSAAGSTESIQQSFRIAKMLT